MIQHHLHVLNDSFPIQVYIHRENVIVNNTLKVISPTTIIASTPKNDPSDTRSVPSSIVASCGVAGAAPNMVLHQPSPVFCTLSIVARISLVDILEGEIVEPTYTRIASEEDSAEGKNFKDEAGEHASLSILT